MQAPKKTQQLPIMQAPKKTQQLSILQAPSHHQKNLTFFCLLTCLFLLRIPPFLSSSNLFFFFSSLHTWIALHHPSSVDTLSHKTTNLPTHSYWQKISPTIYMHKFDGDLTPKP